MKKLSIWQPQTHQWEERRRGNDADEEHLPPAHSGAYVGVTRAEAIGLTPMAVAVDGVRYFSREQRLAAIGVRTGSWQMRHVCARRFGWERIDRTQLRLDDASWRADPVWEYDDGG